VAKDNTTTYAALAFGLFLLFSGSASAKPSQPPIPDLPIDDPDEPVPDPVPSPDNWGSTPPGLILEFEKAEQASGIPGIGRMFAIWAWGAFRAQQPFVSPQEAAAIAAANPNLCQNCHNTSNAEKVASRRALENVVLPLGQLGQYGTGKYKNPWPMPADFNAWADFGSAGLLDILAGSHAHSGIHQGKFTPLISYSPDILFRRDVQLYIGGYMVQRIIAGPYKILTPGDPAETWTKIRRVTASPSAFQSNTQYSIDVGVRFRNRAVELGIDLNKLAYPFPTKWPGAKSYFEKLGVLKS
jgi:hypothetical protein